MLEELKENPVKYLKTLAMDIVVVIVAFGYIFYQMLTFKTTELNPLILIAESIMGIICGVVIKQALGENGFSRGYNSIIWQTEEDKYNNVCNGALGYMDRVDNFNISQEIELKTNYRRNHLQEVRLKYSDWFDKLGNYIGDDSKLDRTQKKMLKKCIKVKVYPLNLFGEYTISSEQATKKEISVKSQRTKNIAKNSITATLVAIIGVYFVPIMQWDVASLIAATMQVALWVLFGILQLYSNYNFVVQDKVAVLKKKKELIERFKKECDKGLHQVSPYTDLLLIENNL